MLKAAALVFALSFAAPILAADIAGKRWNHGAADCRANPGPPVEVYRHDPVTFILRQAKCVHFEAPFVYVLFGEHTAFVQDTGATADASLSGAIDELVRERVTATGRKLEVVVTHSHSHADHTAGDVRFRERPGVTLVEPTAEAVRGYFGFVDWPDRPASIDLGGRRLVVMPAPGHQEESVAVHDSHTGWLLTGDTLYPGRLVVQDWDAYRASIARLAAYARAKRVTAILGTHIEMASSGQLFPPGATFQPQEASLVLAVEDLLELDRRLKEADQPTEIASSRFVVTPMTGMQRIMSRIGKWLR